MEILGKQLWVSRLEKTSIAFFLFLKQLAEYVHTTVVVKNI